jgi:hypothetical protein
MGYAKPLPRGERRGEWSWLIVRAFLIGDVALRIGIRIDWDSGEAKQRKGKYLAGPEQPHYGNYDLQSGRAK